AWFDASFPGPTEAQAGAWDAISRGEHTLVVAPTGSGKTLSAFLWAIDRIVAGHEPAHLSGSTPDAGPGTAPRPTGPADPGTAQGEPRGRCRVLYVSPLKALAVD